MTAITARDLALENVEKSTKEWSDRAYLFCKNYLRKVHKDEEFIGEKLRHWLVNHKFADIGPPPKPEAMGALCMRLIREDIIEKTGHYSHMLDTHSHGRESRIYRWVQ